MNNFMYKTLHSISYLSSYLISFCLVFFIQNYTLGIIPQLKNITFGYFYLKDIIFIISSLIIVYKYVDIKTPYKKYLSK